VVCDGDGKIIAAGKTVAQVQPGTWFRMAVAFGLGTQKPDYEVTVEAPGQEPRTVAALPYASPWFSRCDSLYFIGAGESAASFYLDDVALERLPAP